MPDHGTAATRLGGDELRTGDAYAWTPDAHYDFSDAFGVSGTGTAFSPPLVSGAEITTLPATHYDFSDAFGVSGTGTAFSPPLVSGINYGWTREAHYDFSPVGSGIRLGDYCDGTLVPPMG